jgi:hypothetical protein
MDSFLLLLKQNVHPTVKIKFLSIAVCYYCLSGVLPIFEEEVLYVGRGENGATRVTNDVYAPDCFDGEKVTFLY